MATVIQEIRRNIELKKWVDSTFKTIEEQTAAWDMFRKLIEMYPEFEDRFRGEVIFKGVQQ